MMAQFGFYWLDIDLHTFYTRTHHSISRVRKGDIRTKIKATAHVCESAFFAGRKTTNSLTLYHYDVVHGRAHVASFNCLFVY